MLSIDLIEQLARMNRKRIPEPRIHAKGAGARGIFIPYMSFEDYTRAHFLKDSNQETPVFVRFSSMMGRPGSPDTGRDVRGFSVRFYTQDGIYDLIGSHIPVFYIRDPMKYPALIEALSPDPKTNISDPTRLWHFVASNPETLQMISWLYSDRGTVKNYRSMEGHSVHTYLWENPKEERFYVRYRWNPLLGTKDIDRQEAEFLAGFDPDVAARDLSQTFDGGKTVQYELSVQLIPVKQRTENEACILDPVCVWSESLVPSKKVGKLILNRGVENYEEEVEKANLSPGNLVPGILLANEPLLLATTFLYNDDLRYRLGRDGSFRSTEENRFSVFPIDEALTTDINYNDQLPLRLNKMSPEEKERLIENMAEELLFVDDSIQKIIVRGFYDADRELGTSLEKWLGL